MAMHLFSRLNIAIPHLLPYSMTYGTRKFIAAITDFLLGFFAEQDQVSFDHKHLLLEDSSFI